MKYLRLSHLVLASSLFAVRAFADTAVSVVQVNTPLATSVAGNITINKTGQLNIDTGQGVPPNPNAIRVDAATNANVTISLVAGNTTLNNNAIITQGGGAGDGIAIENGAAGKATIAIGSNTNLTALMDGISVDNGGAVISNSGGIVGDLSAVRLTNKGVDTTLTNQVSGSMQATNAPTLLVEAGGSGLTFLNAGTVTAKAAQNVVQLNANFNAITNQAGGIIQTAQNANTNALHIGGAGVITGSIVNSGIISVGGAAATGAAIQIGNVFNGSIVNHSTGIIQTFGQVNSEAINIGSSFTSIDNSGFIQAVSAGGVAIKVTGPAAGNILNKGTIASVDQPVIWLEESITGIENSGSMLQTAVAANAVLYAAVKPVTLIGGVVNSGTITGTGPNAIDFQTGGVAVQAAVTQNAGTITGDVYLAQADGAGNAEVFHMNGGTVAGNVFAAGVQANTLNLAGGTITKSVTAGKMGDTIALSGTTIVGALNGGIGNDTFNVTGGSFGSLSGKGGGDTLNVNASFTSNGIIDGVGNINVNNAQTVFTNAQPITNLNNGVLTIAASTAFYANANVTGNSDILNNGHLRVKSNIVVDVSPMGMVTNPGTLTLLEGATLGANDYVQTGSLVTYINSINQFGQIIATNNANLNNGAFVQPLLGSTFLPAGSTFNVVQAAGALVDQSSLLPSNSLVVSFTKNVVGNNLQLTAERVPYHLFVSSEGVSGVAANLDFIALPPGPANADLRALLGQLDLSATQLQLNEAFESLAPVVNYALPAVAHIGMNAAFDSVQYRLQHLSHLEPLGTETYRLYREPQEDEGISYGDGMMGIAAWVMPYGAYSEQQTRKQIKGYSASGGGVGIGFDIGDPAQWVAGFVANYTASHATGKTSNHNVTNAQSYQGTFYAAFNPLGPFYVDGMLGVATHNFKEQRNLRIGTISTSALAHFYGYSLGLQAEAGYGFLYDDFTVVPMARVKYTRLELDSYSETGANGLNLYVKNQGLNECIVGTGVRVGLKREYAQAVYLPEVSAMVLYDFSADQQKTTARFFGGGGVFVTQGIKPKHAAYLFSAALEAFNYDNYSCVLKYELTVQDHYFGNTGSFLLRYHWG